MSKIIEKSIYTLQNNLKETCLLHKYQSSFRANFSTDSCLATKKDFVLAGTEKGMHTAMTLINFQTAPDIQDNKILVEKRTCTILHNEFLIWNSFFMRWLHHSWLLNQQEGSSSSHKEQVEPSKKSIQHGSNENYKKIFLVVYVDRQNCISSKICE